MKKVKYKLVKHLGKEMRGQLTSLLFCTKNTNKKLFKSFLKKVLTSDFKSSKIQFVTRRKTSDNIESTLKSKQ